MPSTLPVWRRVLLTALPAPARSSGREPSTAPVTGAITMPIAVPWTSMTTGYHAIGVVASNRANDPIARLATVSAIAPTSRTDVRRVSRTAIGEPTTTPSAAGRPRSEASHAEYWRAPCR